MTVTAALRLVPFRRLQRTAGSTANTSTTTTTTTKRSPRFASVNVMRSSSFSSSTTKSITSRRKRISRLQGGDCISPTVSVSTRIPWSPYHPRNPFHPRPHLVSRETSTTRGFHTTTLFLQQQQKASHPATAAAAFSSTSTTTTQSTTSTASPSTLSIAKEELTTPEEEYDVAAAPAAAAEGLDANNPLFRNSPLYELNLYYDTIATAALASHTNNGSTAGIAAGSAGGSVTKQLLQSEQWQPDKAQGGPVLWTAYFQCPLTGQTFTAGRLRGEEFTVRNNNKENNNEKVDNNNNNNNDNSHAPQGETVFYKKKSVAQQAVAARALDFFRFDEQGILEPRLCHEDPLANQTFLLSSASSSENSSSALSEGEEQGDHHDRNYQQQVASSVNVADEDDVDSDEEENESDDSDDDEETVKTQDASTTKHEATVLGNLEGEATKNTATAVSSPLSFSSLLNDENAIVAEDEDDGEDTLVWEPLDNDGFDDDYTDSVDESSASQGNVSAAEEEFVIIAPQSTSSSMKHTTPAQYVLQSLAGRQSSAQQQQQYRRSPSQASLPMRLMDDPVQEVRQTVAWVNNWVKKESMLCQDQSTAHKLVLRRQSNDENLLVRAKSVLSTLAHSIENVPLGTQVMGTQKAASSVLELLWQTDIAKPDSDTYAIYLHCLDGYDTTSIASKAETVVHSMLNGKELQGHVPPPPNENVYNSLIRLFAQTGGNKSRYEEALSDFTPNADTFIALLSSEAYKRRLGHSQQERERAPFDATFCQQCIERIRELTEGEDTQPDELELLNAPLCWSGGQKQNCRVIPWPHSGKKIKDYNEESFDVQRAKGVQEWVESNPTLQVEPDIVSYEALIQLWVRTCTRKGLGHAENVANKLLLEKEDSPRYPRMQTFHPILALWMHSRDPDAGINLKDWTDRIFAAAASTSRITPDARLYEVALLSRWMLLKNAADNPKSDEMRMDPLDALSIARECTSLLKEFCNAATKSYTEPEGPIFTSIWRPFFLTLYAWQMAAKVCAVGKQDSVALPQEIHTELRFVKTEFELLVSALADYDASPSQSGKLSDIMRETVSNAHLVYIQYVSVLHRILYSDTVSLDDFSSSVLIDVEDSIRKMGELNEFHTLHFMWMESMETPVELTGKVYGDYFDYNLDSLFSRGTSVRRSSFPWAVAKLLRTITESETVHTGDIVRQCQLLNQISRAWNFKTGKFEEEVASILDKALPLSKRGESVLESVRRSSASGGKKKSSFKRDNDQPNQSQWLDDDTIKSSEKRNDSDVTEFYNEAVADAPGLNKPKATKKFRRQGKPKPTKKQKKRRSSM